MASETFTFYIQPWYRKSPYFEATKRHGCASWGLYNHMLLPTLYDDPITEYRALLNDVTLWDVAVERCVEVRGPDAFDLVNLVTCRDLTKVEPMQARYVLLTAPWGGIVNDPVLLRLDGDRFWLALADSDALLYVAGVAGARAMDVSIFEADVAPMQIQGPRSKDVMRDLSAASSASCGPAASVGRRGSFVWSRGSGPRPPRPTSSWPISGTC
jgi:glycine cleavage system aminomethyltransferase T